MRQEDTQQSFQEPNINDGLEAADSSAAPINLNEEIVDSEIESTPDPQTVPETKPPSAAELDPQPTTKPVPEPVVEPTPNNPVSPQNKPSPEVGHVQIVSESDPFSELPPYEGPPIPQAELSKTIENVNPPLNQALPKMQSENELAAPETNAAEAVPNDQTNESPQPTTPTEQPTNEQSPATDPPAPLPDAKVETNPSPIRPDGEISDIKLTTSTPSPSNDAVTQTSWQPNEIQLLVIFFLVLLLIAIAIWNFRKIQDFVSKFFLKEKALKPGLDPVIQGSRLKKVLRPAHQQLQVKSKKHHLPSLSRQNQQTPKQQNWAPKTVQAAATDPSSHRLLPNRLSQKQRALSFFPTTELRKSRS
jgi:hypothetical protein